MKKLLGALLCVAATSPVFAAVNSVQGSNKLEFADLTPASVTTNYSFSVANQNSINYSVALDNLPFTSGTPMFIVTFPEGGDKLLELKQEKGEQTGTLDLGRQLTPGSTYTIDILVPVNKELYNDDLISQGRLKLAQALLKVEGYKMSLGTPENVGQRTADVPYTIEYVGGSEPEGYTFDTWVSWTGNDSAHVEGKTGRISLTGLNPGATYQLYQKYNIKNSEGQEDNSLRFTNDTHTATLTTLQDDTYKFDWKVTPSYDATTQTLTMAYEFVRVGEDTKMPEDATFVCNLGTNYEGAVCPDNDKDKTTQTGAYVYTNVPNNAELTFWPHTPIVSFGGSNYTTTVNGEPAGGTFVVKTADVQSGVAAVAVENGEAVYYNMQGVRVMNPEKGMYIVVKNGKAQKVAL